MTSRYYKMPHNTEHLHVRVLSYFFLMTYRYYNMLLLLLPHNTDHPSVRVLRFFFFFYLPLLQNVTPVTHTSASAHTRSLSSLCHIIFPLPLPCEGSLGCMLASDWLIVWLRPYNALKKCNGLKRARRKTGTE